MAFSLNLPFWVCYRATKLARRWKRIEPMDQNGYDPETYFGYQGDLH